MPRTTPHLEIPTGYSYVPLSYYVAVLGPGKISYQAQQSNAVVTHTGAPGPPLCKHSPTQAEVCWAGGVAVPSPATWKSHWKVPDLRDPMYTTSIIGYITEIQKDLVQSLSDPLASCINKYNKEDEMVC